MLYIKVLETSDDKQSAKVWIYVNIKIWKVKNVLLILNDKRIKALFQ